jgi:hypothetical protein
LINFTVIHQDNPSICGKFCTVFVLHLVPGLFYKYSLILNISGCFDIILFNSKNRTTQISFSVTSLDFWRIDACKMKGNYALNYCIIQFVVLQIKLINLIFILFSDRQQFKDSNFKSVVFCGTMDGIPSYTTMSTIFFDDNYKNLGYFNSTGTASWLQFITQFCILSYFRV